MPTKRAVLAGLSAEELRANVDYYELAVADLRVKAQLVDALAGARRARVDEILADLSRDRLKELCRALGLEDSGRRKADLVARLMAPAAVARSNDKAADPPAPPRPAAAPSRPAAAPTSPSGEALSVAQLEQYLWSAADILRGSIDSSDYKTYIFGLLFLQHPAELAHHPGSDALGRLRRRPRAGAPAPPRALPRLLAGPWEGHAGLRNDAGKICASGA